MKAYRYVGKSAVVVEQTEAHAATVVDLWVHPDDRGRGLGRRLMEATCRDADREGVTLYLRPHPFGTWESETDTFHPPALTHRQLCKFYRSFGFRFKPKPFENTMIRRPR